MDSERFVKIFAFSAFHSFTLSIKNQREKRPISPQLWIEGRKEKKGNENPTQWYNVFLVLLNWNNYYWKRNQIFCVTIGNEKKKYEEKKISGEKLNIVDRSGCEWLGWINLNWRIRSLNAFSGFLLLLLLSVSVFCPPSMNCVFFPLIGVGFFWRSHYLQQHKLNQT